jgi:nitrite reductase (NO-forming)/hydroxylamine reductase
MRPDLARLVPTIIVPLVLSLLVGVARAQPEEPTPLTEDERAAMADIYFDRCAGCHGVLRHGATGPALTPDTTRQRGSSYLEAVIFGGLPGGMPDWGRQGLLDDEQVALMARYLQEAPPEPPQASLDDILDTWTVHVPPDERPTQPRHDLDWENFFGIILRDMGQVAIVDGSSRALVALIDTGYAIHILRSSADGRYFTAIGRDGKASLIDLWYSPPRVVAEVKPCNDARSIESSKFEGFENEYAIVGCYWPPMFAVLDGATLEPLKMVATQGYERGAGAYVEEARVAAIVASEAHPEWIVNIKETGQTWLVDYSRLEQDGRPMPITMIDTDLYLHDGGWARERYFIVAANALNKLIVIDSVERQVAAEIDVGVRPHPGRGANWDHPEFGPLWATGNLGSPEMTVIGADPDGHPDVAWEVVTQVELPYTGTLFNKTHENSPWILVDFTMSSNPEGAASLCAIGKASLEVEHCWEVPGAQEIGARMVHIEFDRGGEEFWVSAWGSMTEPSFVAIYDAVTLEETGRVQGDWVRTPTGKFNVYNTAHEVY